MVLLLWQALGQLIRETVNREIGLKQVLYYVCNRSLFFLPPPALFCRGVVFRGSIFHGLFQRMAVGPWTAADTPFYFGGGCGNRHYFAALNQKGKTGVNALWDEVAHEVAKKFDPDDRYTIANLQFLYCVAVGQLVCCLI